MIGGRKTVLGVFWETCGWCKGVMVEAAGCQGFSRHSILMNFSMFAPGLPVLSDDQSFSSKMFSSLQKLTCPSPKSAFSPSGRPFESVCGIVFMVFILSVTIVVLLSCSRLDWLWR